MIRKITLLFFGMLVMGLLPAQIVITEINYNPDGTDDIEFIELYNNGGTAIDLEGYQMVGVTYTFPARSIEPGAFLLLTENAKSFEGKFGMSAIEWDDGSLGNGGEEIVLRDSSGVALDSVIYDDRGVWPGMPDGFSASLVICDVNSDNNVVENWQSATTKVDIVNGARPVYANPGSLGNVCESDPVVYFTRSERMAGEGRSDTVSQFVILENYNGNPSSVAVGINPASTASPDDYELITTTVEFSGTESEQIAILIAITNDTEVEGTEFIQLELTPLANVGNIYSNNAKQYIYDNDTELKEGLILVGVFSTETLNSSQDEFGVELYAVKNIPDLSIYSIGAANNGGGTDGIEVRLPAISLNAGKSYFVSDDSTRFNDFFGFYPNFTHPSMFVTGNDAIELFEGAQVIDLYGERDIDGAGEPYDYDAGWAVRISEGGPGSTFIISDWIISGINELTGEVNDSCSMPYPLGQYTNSNTETPLSTKNLNASLQAQISPNPVMDQLLISFDAGTEVIAEEATIFSLRGKAISSMSIPKGASQANMDTAGLVPGIYFVGIRTSEGLITLKFIKN